MELAPVTVVIPCWQAADTLERAIASVHAQTWPPAEIILVDDASIDGTADVIARVCDGPSASSIRSIRLAQNSGPGAARNAGWEAATQPLIAFLDADDAWHPEKLAIQARFMLEHPDSVLCGTASVPFPGPALAPDPAADRYVITPRQMLISNRILTRTAMLRREVPERFADRQFTEDYLLWLQIILSGRRAVRLQAPLAFTFREEYGGTGYSSQLWRHEKRELRALELLHTEGHLSTSVLRIAELWSFVKYLRRVVVARLRKS